MVLRNIRSNRHVPEESHILPNSGIHSTILSTRTILHRAPGSRRENSWMTRQFTNAEQFRRIVHGVNIARNVL
jgi:hypothetical protein